MRKYVRRRFRFLQSALSVSPGSDSTDALVSSFCDNSFQSVYKFEKSRLRANTVHVLYQHKTKTINLSESFIRGDNIISTQNQCPNLAQFTYEK